MNFSFLQISDLHYLDDPGRVKPPFSQAFAAMEPPLQQLRTLLSRIDRPLDFVLITGDLVHDGRRGDYSSLKKQLDEILDIPYYVTAGNHDDPELLREVFLAGGPLSYVKELPFARLIAINTGSMDHPDGMVDLAALPLLEQETGGKPTLVFTHHHLLQEQFVLPPAEGGEQLLSVLRRGTVQAVLCGHTHHQYQGRIGPVSYYTADSLSFSAENERDGKLSIYQNSGATLFDFTDGTLHSHPLKLASERLLCRVKM